MERKIWPANPRIKILVGHYGSGKTEIALNMARSLRPADVALVDLDIVNPFFRSAEKGKWLKEQGISVFAPEFALTAVDIPSLPAAILSVFENDRLNVVFDVGGDSAGATALGIYHEQFEKCGYAMYYVVNCFRPRSATAAEILSTMEGVCASSRLTISGLINNANLGGETTARHLAEGQDILEQVSRASGVPVVAMCGTKEALGRTTDAKAPFFEIERLLKPEWMEV